MSETLPVPPEIVAKAEAALARRARCYADGRPTVAETVLAAVYGDIVAEKDAEIARLRVERDAAQAEAYRLMLENAGQRGELDACEDAIEICEADRDRAVAEARREALREAADAIVGSVRYGAELNYDGTENPGMAAYVEGIRDAARIVADLADAPRTALRSTESVTAATNTPVDASERRNDLRTVIAHLSRPKYEVRETPDGWDVLTDDDHGAFS